MYCIQLDSFVDHLIVHFFCSSKRNEPKKRAPEMPTSAKTGASYTGLIGATVLAAVRTISGLPSRYHLLTCIRLLVFWFQMASENFGIKRLFWGLLRGPAVSNTVWGGRRTTSCIARASWKTGAPKLSAAL